VGGLCTLCALAYARYLDVTRPLVD
jgi:hypothetical protein